MQISQGKQIYIFTVLALVAIVTIVISPTSFAAAQETSEGQSSEQNSEEKSHDGNEKSCAEKKKDRSEKKNASGEQA
jgi:hypothetical protein